MSFLCCFGSADNDTDGPRLAKSSETSPAVERTWEVDSTWATQVSAVNIETPPEITPHQRVRKYIDNIYPQCALVGSTEDMGESRGRMRDGNCSPNTHNEILVLDDNFTGVIYSSVFILNLPAGSDTTPGRWLDSPEMEEAKFYMLNLSAMVEKQKHNLKHSILRIFIGSDCLTCKYRPDNTEPTLTALNSAPPPGYREGNDELARALRQTNEIQVPKGAFRAFALEFAIKNLYETFPGCTVWDEGTFDFKVGGRQFTDPTRLLVARRFRGQPDNHYQPEEAVDARTFRVNKFGEEDKTAPPIKVLQARNSKQMPGGIVAIVLLVATPMAEVWPKCGVYMNSPHVKGAEVAGKELLTKWNAEGKLERCNLTVSMGADHKRFKFISEKTGQQTAVMQSKEGNTTTAPQELPSLQPFFIELKEENEHNLFESEVQFQAIKQVMRQKMIQDPDHYRAMAPQLAVMSAEHFLQMNYPGCEVCDEGEFPVVINGAKTTIGGTRLMMAVDPTKPTNNIVAAMHLVPLPGDQSMTLVETMDKTWLETREIQVAEQLLLGVLKEWYKENRLADDCMAQVIMGNDATIYRFVGGERFEDYPEERQKKFVFG